MNTEPIAARSLPEVTALTGEHHFVILYLSRPDCGVCSALKPKISELVGDLPQAIMVTIDLDELPAAAGAYNVFTIPAIILYVDGRETIREARYISLGEFRERVTRLYSLRFGE